MSQFPYEIAEIIMFHFTKIAWNTPMVFYEKKNIFKV